MCETSPDLLQQMEATLHGTNGTPSKGASNHDSSFSLASPLSHLGAATDALALQESVIGGRNIKPAPPDVVAQVVASVQNQWHPENLQPNPLGSPSREARRPVENCPNLVVEAVKTGSSGTTAEQSQLSIEPLGSPDQSKLKLHRFPKDRITTVVEKQNWLSRTSVKELVSHSDASCSYPETVLRETSHCSSPTLYEADGCLGSPSDAATLPEEYLNTSQTVSEINSVTSEKFEVESNLSEPYELQSNISEASGLEDEEMFQIKKLLLETSSGLETVKGPNVVDVQSHLDVLREKAVMEGQLEVLSLEVESAVRERFQLQNQLASAKSVTTNQATLLRSSEQEIEAVRAQCNELKGKLNESEDVIVALRGSLDAKVEEVLQSREEALLHEHDAQQCRIALQEMKVDAESKDGAIRGLKNKVAELHVELQNLLQGKLRAESDLQTRSNQLAAEEKMKEWYRQQFQESQAAKGRLQQDVIGLQTVVANHESSVDKLTFERDQSRQQLAELQERAVREKEGLLRHLENIEADMREREILFQQMQRDQGSVEESVLLQMKKVEEERAKWVQETFTRSELERQLTALKSESDAKSSAIEGLEREVAQFVKQLTVLQKTMNEKELEIHAFGERHVEQERQYKELQLLSQAKEKHLDTMKQEKTAVEVELKAARREKEEMDATLVDVRNNVLKLDGRLKQMREELNVKMTAIDKLKQEKLVLEDERKTKEILLDQHKRKLVKAEDELQKLRQELRDIRLAKEKVDREKEKLSDDLAATVARLETVSSVHFATLGEEFSETKTASCVTDNQLQQLRVEKNQLQNSAASKFPPDDSTEMPHSRKLPETRTDLVHDGEMDQGTSSDATPLQSNFEFVHPEFVPRTECDSNHFVNPNVPSNELPVKEEHSQTDAMVESLRNDIKEQRRRYESNIRVLSRKLKASLNINKTHQEEVKTLEDKLAESVKALHLVNSEQALLNQTSNDNNSSKSNDGKIIYYRKKIKSLENKLAEMRKLHNEEQKRADHNQTLLIELEKQKGKLHALAEHHTARQQQTSELEAALFEKETAVSNLDQQVKDAQARKQREETQIRETLKELQQKLVSEQEITRDLRKQVFKEKCESSHWRKNAASLKGSMEEVSRMLDGKRNELTNVESELEKQQQLTYSLRAEVGALEMKLLKSQEEINGLRKEMEQNQAKDPLLADQIKTLSWHLHQKNQVISTMKDQSKQREAQCLHEVERIDSTLQIVKRELEVVKSELEATMKEKFDYQNQVTELRSALKLSLERNKSLQIEYTKHLNSDDAVSKSDIKLFEAKLFESPAPYDESLIAALLQKSLIMPESRPLNNLQVCLNTLKQEMAILQHQLLNQTHGNH